MASAVPLDPFMDIDYCEPPISDLLEENPGDNHDERNNTARVFAHCICVCVGGCCRERNG
jgi:hypothetical protein